jgi:RNA recognition motif-containing protein
MHVPKHFGLAALFCGELFTTDAYPAAYHTQYGYFRPRTARHRRRIQRRHPEQDVSLPVYPIAKVDADINRLYVRNLPDKLQKEDLKRNLYMLFATYGVILDIVALKTMKMRGQAHVVFRDVDSSTQAMRALQGFTFFGKDMVRTTRS